MIKRLLTAAKVKASLLALFALVVFSLPAAVYAQPNDVNVPNVVGMTQIAAETAITDVNLTVGTVSYQYSDTVDANLVISQDPNGGTSVPIGSSVDLIVS
ncbi:MAG: PASTA domain-containing protein, partial [Planctomycetota bacterium]